MSANYIFRLDDLCDRSDFNKWNMVIETLMNFKIYPLIAVVPNNKDPDLNYQPKKDDFWEYVKNLKKLGCEIALHGYKHEYHKININNQILPFHPKSEFAELSAIEQSNKIQESYKIFKTNNVIPRIFIAPGHSFDKNTIKALRSSSDIRIISDTISLNPYKKDSFYYIPQQLWSFKKKFFGTWTICLHPNTMTESDINILKSELYKNHKKFNFISPKDINLNDFSEINILDLIYEKYFWLTFKIKNRIKKIIKF